MECQTEAILLRTHLVYRQFDGSALRCGEPGRIWVSELRTFGLGDP